MYIYCISCCRLRRFLPASYTFIWKETTASGMMALFWRRNGRRVSLNDNDVGLSFLARTLHTHWGCFVFAIFGITRMLTGVYAHVLCCLCVGCVCVFGLHMYYNPPIFKQTHNNNNRFSKYKNQKKKWKKKIENTFCVFCAWAVGYLILIYLWA